MISRSASRSIRLAIGAVAVSLCIGQVASAQSTDTLVLRQQAIKQSEQRASDQKQKVRTAPTQRRNPGTIGSSQRMGEVPANCEDAWSMIAQWGQGGSGSSQSYNHTGMTTGGQIASMLGSMDASKGVTNSPWASQHEGRRPRTSAFERPLKGTQYTSNSVSCMPLK